MKKILFFICLLGLFHFTGHSQPVPNGEACFQSPTNPLVTSKITWVTNPDGTITIRATLAKTYVDNTYGTNAIGWPGGHKFSNLTGSDKLQLSLFDASNALQMKFDLDYLSTDPSSTSGYGSLGVAGGDGDMITGNESDIVSARTSLDVNFNDFDYVLTTNSPATDASYTPNPAFPNWIFDVWYEVTVKGTAFPGGFRSASQTAVHASPSKIKGNTVVPVPCLPTGLTVGNLVWLDLNSNGLKEAAEPGIDGAIVNLYADADNNNVPDGAAVATTSTDAAGNYKFTALTAGNYIGGVVLPAGYSLVAIDGGDPDNDIDNDNNGLAVVGGEARSNAVTLSTGGEPVTDGDGNNSNLTVDFALFTNLKVSLGDLVWDDNNNNGIKDLAENGIVGVTVNLYNDADANDIPDGAAIASTVTAVGGFYGFATLTPGNYIAGVELPAGFVKGGTIASSADPNNDINNDNNGVNLAGTELRSNSISLTPGSEPITDGDGANGNRTLDFGIYNPTQPPVGGGEACFASPTNPGQVNSKITWVINGDGTITIRATLAKTFVDNTYGINKIGWPGNHSFGNLTGSDRLQLSLFDASNTLRMKFDMDYLSTDDDAPSGYSSLGVSGGEGDMITGNEADVVSVRTSLDANFNDFGYVLTTNSPATDASYTPNPAFPNWIYDVWYEVTVQASAFPGGFGTASQTDVHASPSKTGHNTEIVIPVPCGGLSVGNLVWLDLDADGTKDPAEPGVGGATVNLYADADNNNVPDGAAIATMPTDAAGNYKFTGLAAGNYIVGVVLPAGYTLVLINGGDPDNNIDNDNNGLAVVAGEALSNAVTLALGTEPVTDGDGNNGNLTVDFALETNLQVNLGNLVWDDLNNNGVKDVTEIGVPGVTVRLWNDANADNIVDGPAIASTVTAAGGFYAFNGLTPGNYIAGVTLPAGYTNGGLIASSSNPNNNVDNDNNGVNTVGTDRRSNFISLTPGSEPITDGDGNNGNLTLDFGINSGQPPIGGGEICLQSPTKPDVTSKITWVFNPDGTITIRATLAKTFVDNTYGTNAIGWPGSHSFGNLTGSDHLQLSLFDVSNTLRMKFDMDYMSSDPSRPSGFGSLGVGGGDGDMITGNESDVVSVRTSLDVNFNDFGYVLTTNSPATDANYTPNPAFPNWIYDVWYEVTVKGSAFPGGFGTPNQTDVHASPSKTGDNTEIVIPVPCLKVNIGNLVWKDGNNNGIKDGLELPFPGVTVHLYLDVDNDNVPDAGPIASTVTDMNGNYGFANLPTGFYIVGIVVPFGYSNSAVNGGDPDNDTDFDNNGIMTVAGILRSNAVTLQVGTEPLFDGDGGDGNLTVDFGLFSPTDIPLPVQLLQFTGTGNGNASILNWKVTNESQMKSYVIERSKDGRTFVDAGSVNSVNAAQSHDYSFTETNTSNAAILYYRLKSVGQNGNISYSNVVAVRFGNVPKNVFTVYPNPVKNYVVISLGVTQRTEGVIHMVNKAGQTVLTRSLKLNAGSNAITIDGLGKYVNGIYNLNIKLNDGNQYYQTILLSH